MRRPYRATLIAAIGMTSPISGAQLPAPLAADSNRVAWEHAQTLETMISLWPRREYYLELAAVYERVGANGRETELYEMSYAMGWLTETEFLLRLAQLRLRAGRIDAADQALSEALIVARRRAAEREPAADTPRRR